MEHGVNTRKGDTSSFQGSIETRNPYSFAITPPVGFYNFQRVVEEFSGRDPVKIGRVEMAIPLTL